MSVVYRAPLKAPASGPRTPRPSLPSPGWDRSSHFYAHSSSPALTLFMYLFIVFSMAALMAYGGSQARGVIRAVVAGLCHSHSNAGSKLRLRPTPQLMAMPDPKPTDQGQGLNLYPHGYWSGLLLLSNNGNSISHQTSISTFM